MNQLEPDRNQIEIFAEALFRYAPDNSFVSLRAFYHDNKIFRITPVRLNGNGFRYLCEAAEDDARRAAQAPKPVVFCPPIATFSNSKRAREEDLAAGLALSVELDQHPHEALTLLEEIIGPATIIVRSGGIWIDPDGAPQDKLHVHWRLAEPARGENLAKLKTARALATRIVGADASSIPSVHPLRWPGSWHRKDKPRLCEIARQEPDREIDLDEALSALNAAAPAEEEHQRGNGANHDHGDRTDWAELIGNIIAGNDMHRSDARLASSCAAYGVDDCITARMIQALYLVSNAPHDERWNARFNDIPRSVRSAYAKYAKQQPERTQPSNLPSGEELKAMHFEPIKYVVRGIIVEGLTLLAAKPKIGKSWLMLHVAIAVARGSFTLGEIHCEEGDVLYCALEDNLRRLKSRMSKLLGMDADWPKRLRFMTEMPRLAEGGIDVIREWIKSAPHPRLVVIDTLAMVRAPKKRDESNYELDYAAAKELRDLANEYGIAIVLVHHLRKADSDDPFDTVSGTLGLTGAPDTILVLKRDTSGNVILHGRGRDLTEIEKALAFNRDACTWTITGSASEARSSRERTAILDALGAHGEAATPAEIAALAGLKHGSVKHLVLKMAKDGLLRRNDKGRYGLAAVNG